VKTNKTDTGHQGKDKPEAARGDRQRDRDDSEGLSNRAVLLQTSESCDAKYARVKLEFGRPLGQFELDNSH
jgi:hypothetical protein